MIQKNNYTIKKYNLFEQIIRNNMLFVLSIFFIWFSHIDFITNVIKNSFFMNNSGWKTQIFADIALLYVVLSCVLVICYFIIRLILIRKKIIERINRYEQLITIEACFFTIVVFPAIGTMAISKNSNNVMTVTYCVPFLDIFLIFPLILHYVFVNIDTSLKKNDISKKKIDILSNIISDLATLIIGGCAFAIFNDFETYCSLFKTVIQDISHKEMFAIINLLTVFVPFCLLVVGYVVLVINTFINMYVVQKYSEKYNKNLLVKFIIVTVLTISLISGLSTIFWFTDDDRSWLVLSAYGLIFIFTTTLAFLVINSKNIVNYETQ